MRKVFTIFSILLISFFIISCSSKSPVSTSSAGSDKQPQKYSLELAQNNGDVVSVHGRGYNIEKLDNFIEKLKNKSTAVGDMVRLVTYTIEGDAIIFDLSIASEGLKLIEDNTRDKFSTEENRVMRSYNLVDILKESKEGGIYYMARTDKGKELPLIYVK